jgi:uncharacterized protein YjiS (DUF1127 family)
MSVLAKHYALARADRTRHPLQNVCMRLTDILTQWCWRSRSRGQLARFSRRELLDIGMTPADRECECSKPFWRA